MASMTDFRRVADVERFAKAAGRARQMVEFLGEMPRFELRVVDRARNLPASNPEKVLLLGQRQQEAAQHEVRSIFPQPVFEIRDLICR